MGELPFNYVMKGALCNFPVWNEANTTTSWAEHIKVNK